MPRSVRTAISAAGARGVSGPVPIFDVDFHSSITPTIGTAGSYTRSGDLYYPTGLSTIGKVAANNPPIGSFPTLSGESTLTSKGGIYQLGPRKNYVKYSDLFTPGAPVGNPWTAYGTGGGIDPSVVGVLGPYNTGSNNAGAVYASDAASGVYQDLGVAAGSTSWVFGVWLKTVDATPRSMKLFIEDAASSYAETTCAVTGTWQFFRVYKAFSGATGNVFVSIQSNEAAGTLVHAWGAIAAAVSNSDNGDFRIDYDQLPYIPTTTAAVTLGSPTFYYAGSELTASLSEFTLCAWYYVPNFTANPGTKWIASYNGAAAASLARLYINNTTTVGVYFGTTFVSVSSLNRGAWNHACVGVKTGDHLALVNGATTGTSAAAYTTAAGAALALQDQYAAGASTPVRIPDTQVGRIQLFNARLTQAQMAAIYNAQKSSYGL